MVALVITDHQLGEEKYMVGQVWPTKSVILKE